ncbi:PGF-CTERM sorting domain-containing protein [Haladaptatus sp. DJG-WS-42]|uniref:DUF7490 domain-containing protein n=1 Tax=Haladaptatus sp. DJG-WS-42 TaxID=3120516 RepID=UPI0030D35DD6
MRKEVLLAGGVGLLVVVSLLTAFLVPGTLADPELDREPAGRLGLEEMTITSTNVTGGSATLSVDTRLSHRGGPSENVTILLRAIDLDTGLVETETTLTVGTIESEKEVSAVGSLTVARTGGYRIESIAYVNDRRIERGTKEVRGVETLTPAYARTATQFHEFPDRPSLEYRIQSVSENRAMLNVSTYLTNTGDEADDDLRLVVTARQADSNIVADEASVQVGEIAPGRTAAPSVTLDVPDGYNYYLDATLWKDGVIVGNTRSAANLNPNETVSVNTTERDTGLQSGDFVTDSGGRENPTGTETQTEESGPGFGILAALVAIATLALIKRGPHK